MKRILTLVTIFILIYSQNNFTQGWQWIDTGYPCSIYDMSFPPGQSNIGFAVGSYSTSSGIIFKTTDGGSTWSKISTDTIPGLKTVCFTSTDVGYAGGYQNCLMKTTDSGSSWVLLTNYSRSLYINNIEFWNSNNGIYDIYPSTVFITTDAGTSWHFAFGIKQTVEDICYANANTLYMVGGDEKISKSTDGGIHWTDIYSGTPFSVLSGVEFFTPDYGIVGGENGKVLITTDGGINWTNRNAGGIGLMSGVHIFSEQIAYVAGAPEQVFKTTDGGLTWVSDFNGANTIALYKIKFTENNIGLICGSQGKILTNTDYVIPVELTGFTATVERNNVHLNWTTKTELNNYGFEILRSIGDAKWEKIAFIPGFGTTSESKNYSFTDEQLNNGSYSYRLKQMDFSGSFEYSDVVNVFISILVEYSLEQNYPNPFNPATTIKFSIPEATNVTLTIYNTLGQKVTELVHTNFAAGRYSSQWDASNFNSGIYFYELRTDKSILMKKMVLLK